MRQGGGKRRGGWSVMTGCAGAPDPLLDQLVERISLVEQNLIRDPSPGFSKLGRDPQKRVLKIYFGNVRELQDDLNEIEIEIEIERIVPIDQIADMRCQARGHPHVPLHSGSHTKE